MLKIYCVRSISGRSPDEVFDYYQKTQKTLTDYGYDVLVPLYGKNQLRCEKEFKAADYRSPVSTNAAIFGRDKWMVLQADIIYATFVGVPAISIGSCFELAWASDHNKHIVIVMEKENIHRHAFVIEAAHIVLESEQEALDYLRKLAQKEY